MSQPQPVSPDARTLPGWKPSAADLPRMAILACLYLAAAWVGHQVALFAGYASPLWPATGLALAGLGAWGVRCWPGVLVGAVLTHLLVLPAETKTAVQLLFALGATLQAVAGAYLIWRFITSRDNFSDRRMLGLLIVCGPVICLISASLGAATLAWATDTPRADLVSIWFTWWAGDSVGVLLFAPPALALWPRAAEQVRRRWESGWHVALMPAVTVVLLVGGLVQISKLEVSRSEAVSMQQLDMLTDRALLQLIDAVEPLRGVVRHFEASDDVSRESFARFTQDIALYPAILAIDWAPRVTQANRRAFELAVQQVLSTDFVISDPTPQGGLQPSPPRADYYPVLYTEPLANNLHALGLDHGRDLVRNEMMKRAVGAPGKAWPWHAATGRTQRPSVMVFLPVPATLVPAMDGPEGFVVGVLDQERLLAPLLKEASEHDIALRIRDARMNVLHDSLPANTHSLITRSLSHGGLDWQLEMLPPHHMRDASSIAALHFYLGFSVLAALLVAFAVLGSAGRTAATNARVAARTADLAKALTSLHEREAEERAVLDNIVECVITIDSNGIVLNANRALTPMFGYSPKEVIGQNVSMLMQGKDAAAHDGYILHYLTTGERRIIGRNREVEGRHSDGHRIPLELAVSEYVFGSRRVFTGTLRDISERKSLVSDLTRARELADEANRAKSAFLAAMSHEIRTPMNGVVGLIDVLARSDLDEYQRDLVRTVRESSTTLLTLIDDILDFSKIEAGRLEIEHRPVSVTEVVEGVCSSLSPLAVRRGVDITLFIAPEVPAGVLSDEVRLRQVLYNIVGNAIKFSGGRADVRGSVHLQVGLSPDRQRLSFDVRDNGIGIEAARLNDLFRPFTQAESSTTRRYGGTGLGLAICRRLMELMGGEITVRSSLGEGSTFSVTLPCEISTEILAAEPPDLSGLEVLLLPGCARTDSEILHSHLQRAGVTVHAPVEINAAYTALESMPSPRIVLDCVRDGAAPSPLPPTIADVRTVRITRGRSTQTRSDSGATLVVDGNVLRRTALLRAVAIAAGRASPERSAIDTDVHDRHTGVTPPTVAQARAQGRLILVAEDNEINRKVIRQQLALLGFAAEIAEDGAEALRMWQEGRYALLLTDLHMPIMDGYALTAAIRNAEAPGIRIPILALTANALRGEERRALNAGMDAYLTKPVPIEQLRDTLEGYLPPAAEPATQVAPADTSPVPVSASDLPIFDVSVLEELVGDDQVIVREFLEEFRLSAASLANTLRHALAASNAREAASAAHKFKSAARSVGALALGELCAEIERCTREHDGTTLPALLPAFNARIDETSAQIDAYLDSEPRP